MSLKEEIIHAIKCTESYSSEEDREIVRLAMRAEKELETLEKARSLVDDIKSKIDRKSELTDIEVDLLILSSVIHNRSLAKSTLSENHKRLI